MSLMANSPTDRVTQLLALVDRLTVLIREETAAFVAREPGLDEAKLAEKNRLAAAYRAESTLIARDKSLIASAPAALKTKLRTAVTALNAALSDGETAVVGLRTVCEGMVKAMAEEVARSRRAQSPYGPTPNKPKSDRAHAVTLDKSA